jgi:3-oxoacyl-[acyl-carrier-protein] synthase-3
VPPRVVTNHELAEVLDTTDEWIRTRTGIVQRHIADPGVATSDLAIEAGRRAMKSAAADTVDIVVLATTTPDRPCPGTAPEVAARLGLRDVAAFDLQAVCTGFVYGLAVATGLITAGIGDRILLIGADTYSTILNPEDRTTACVFGDGAGAVVLRAGTSDELGAISSFDLGSDGEGADLIMIPAGGSRQRSWPDRQVAPTDQYFAMKGKTVYRNAVLRMTASAQQTMTAAGWRADEVDRFVGHQANRRILEAVADRLTIPLDRCVINVDRVGNTSAASIPVALADGAASGTLRAGQKVVMTAFGGGLTWGSSALHWPEIVST